MTGQRSSSLVADLSHILPRHGSGLHKHTKERVSKQDLTGHRLFRRKRGMHGKDIKVGRKFREHSSTRHGAYKQHDHSMHRGDGYGVGPSVEEFDDMMERASGSHKNGKMKKQHMLQSHKMR